MYVAEENIIMASLIFVHNRFVEYIFTKTTTYVIPNMKEIAPIVKTIFV